MTDADYMRLAIRLARRGLGCTSPNPLVGAVLVKGKRVIGQGWHRKAGGPHAEVEAIRDADRRRFATGGATLYITLEPCSTHGRTPPCTDAIKTANIKRVVIGATDPNPVHSGRAVRILRKAGINVRAGVIEEKCCSLNPVFNHWIVHRTPLVTVKAAMTLDGKIATRSGESKWITGARARDYSMKLRQRHDAILVGINTVLADNPSLTARKFADDLQPARMQTPRRIILDSMARTPPDARVVDEHASLTTIVVSRAAPRNRVAVLDGKVRVLVAPQSKRKRSGCSPSIDLAWLLKTLGREHVTSLLVEGGGEVNASFLLGGFANHVAFFYAPKILGGEAARKAVAGEGVSKLSEAVHLQDVRWRRLGDDLLMTADVLSAPHHLR